MEEGDVVEIQPPVNWASKPRSRKRKEVFCPDIINIDDYEDSPVSVLDSWKSHTRFKGKQKIAEYSLQSSAGTDNNASGNDVKFMGESYGGSHYSNEGFSKDLIKVNDDEMEYALLQSHLDDFDIPTGIELSIPWITIGDSFNPHVERDTKKLKPCSNKPAASGNVQVSSSSYSGNPGPSQAYGFHATSDRGMKILPPQVIHTRNQFSTPANTFPEASMSTRNDKPQTSHKQVLHGLNNRISSAANNFPKASMPTRNEKPLVPRERLLHSLQNYTSSAAYSFPKASMLTGNEKPLRSVEKRMSTAANKFSKASMPTGNGSFYNQGPNMNSGMSSNVGVNHMFPGHNFPAQNPLTASSYFSGGFNFPVGFNFSETADFNPLTDPSYFSGGFNFSETANFNPLFPNSWGIQKDLTSTGIVSSSSGPSSSKSVNEDPDVILKKLDLFKKFDTVEDYSDHLFSKSNAFATNQPARSWAKKIQDEWRILEKDLPDTIFVRVYESRMDLLRAAIIGAEGTPYHDGLFFFDMFFPNNYPKVPPQVKYHSGGLRINPNLYNCGKVCLSLLNTWSGSAKEKWIPGKSTILQVLVSIQGLILNEKPYFNEPGYARMGGTVAGENRSLDYNENTFIYSLKTMVYSIRKPPKHFEDLVVGHFFKRAHDILVACRAYKNGAQLGSVVVKGGVANVNNDGQKGNSQSFKMDLAVVLKTLVEAFAQVGVNDCDKFL